jgi:hypothetical protein
LKKEATPFVDIGVRPKLAEDYPLTGRRYLELADLALGNKPPEKKRKRRVPPTNRITPL